MARDLLRLVDIAIAVAFFGGLVSLGLAVVAGVP